MAEQIVDALIMTNTALFGEILNNEECENLAGLLGKLAAGLQLKKQSGA